MGFEFVKHYWCIDMSSATETFFFIMSDLEYTKCLLT